MLKFLGIGSCFNYTMGNTSAYYINEKEKSLFLIDCGETVFTELMKREILENVDKVTVVITHLHSDHIGSLPSLIFYSYILYGIKVEVIYPDKADMKEKILFTVPEYQYEIYTPEEYSKDVGEYKINTINQKHSPNINSYGYEIVIDGKHIYYSGDTNILPKYILKKFLNYEYDYFYHEVTKFKNEVHHHIDTLVEEIPEERRKDVTCIHMDDEELLQLVKELGFNVPTIQL